MRDEGGRKGGTREAPPESKYFFQEKEEGQIAARRVLGWERKEGRREGGRKEVEEIGA